MTRLLAVDRSTRVTFLMTFHDTVGFLHGTYSRRFGSLSHEDTIFQYKKALYELGTLSAVRPSVKIEYIFMFWT